MLLRSGCLFFNTPPQLLNFSFFIIMYPMKLFQIKHRSHPAGNLPHTIILPGKGAQDNFSAMWIHRHHNTKHLAPGSSKKIAGRKTGVSLFSIQILVNATFILQLSHQLKTGLIRRPHRQAVLFSTSTTQTGTANLSVAHTWHSCVSAFRFPANEGL